MVSSHSGRTLCVVQKSVLTTHGSNPSVLLSSQDFRPFRIWRSGSAKARRDVPSGYAPSARVRFVPMPLMTCAGSPDLTSLAVVALKYRALKQDHADNGGSSKRA